MKKLREAYSYIIIDTPPMAGLIDGAVVAGDVVLILRAEPSAGEWSRRWWSS